MSANRHRKLYEQVRERVGSVTDLGHETLPSGAEVFGHVPETGPDAWLHALYPGLDDEELDAVADDLDRSVPAAYADWLRLTNGLELFVTTLALFGVVREGGRDPRNRQPFALSIHNVDERPGDAGDEDFFIGTYDWDGSLLYLRGDDERVYRGTRESVDPLTEWDSLESMLLSEFDRLSEYFDEQGRERDPDRPTIPA
jgi:hypothetical protein